MRTDQEIAARLKTIEREDVFGFESSDLIETLPYEAAKPWLKPEYDGKDWCPAARDREAVLARLKEYMPFAWEKANNCRGISAARSLYHMRAWLWLMGEDAFIAALDPLRYDLYGKPKLREICERFGVDWRSLDDGNWTNDEGGAGLPADQVPRIAACAALATAAD